MAGRRPRREERREVVILGGGPAGCAVAHSATRAGLPFTLIEAGPGLGGNCRTLERGPFRFDSGAHRFLGTFPEVTAEFAALFPGEWNRITAPSQIFRAGRMIGFPLAPYDLLANLGPLTFGRAVLSWAHQNLRRDLPAEDFESVALKAYGRVIAGEFLLNYSEKLWGLPCAQLSTAVSGKRLKGIDARTFLFEALRGRRATIEMQDGAFFYPPGGIGSLWSRMAARFPAGSVRTGARVARVHHDGARIVGVEIEGGEVVAPGAVFTTLALPDLFAMLTPAPEAGLLDLAGSLRFRALRLVVLFLERESVTPNGAVYFPGYDLPFTRISEPRNRDRSMSPPGRTSLVVEVPCSEGETLAGLHDDALIALVQDRLHGIGFLDRREVSDAAAWRLPHAYPILRKGVELAVAPLLAHLARFENLYVSGRNARFEYALIHDVFRQGQRNVERHLERAGRVPR